MTRVLIVDDEPGIRETLAITLRASGYDIDTASDGEDALARAGGTEPDIVVLDLGLPDLDGIQVIAQLRAISQAPILVLSGRTDSADKVDALDAGADDYVTKPFGMDELLARLRAMSRRTGPDEIDPFCFGAAEIDVVAKRVTVARDGMRHEEHLTPTEWRLLEAFLESPGRLLSQADLLSAVWGPGYETAQGNLRLYMAQLRRKLEVDPARPRHFVTEPGLGYRLQV
ncbi:response regulator [Nocardioides seonyuensis]|uniref:Response regulator n=1 Tax=Nocardioides seonyuensis TaxID=2518371 RepID=A0A4P7IB09_9ACTN|nr:response regulator [Nocardioides seonyuensis]QBX54224.1 response regulator [Nocardioides seonyuensis]